MRYVCLECMNIFEDGEEAHWIEPHGEAKTGCPVCGGAYDYAAKCHGCYGDFHPDNLIDGWCEECLTDRIWYDDFWQFLVDTNWVSDFVSERIWGMPMIDEPNDELLDVMKSTFKTISNFEKRVKGNTLMKQMEAYILENEIMKKEFAEWLTAQLEKNKKKEGKQ